MFLHKFNSCSFSGIQHFFLLIQTHTPHTYRSWIPNGTKRSEDCAESTVSALLNGNVMENVSDKKRNVHHWCIYFMRCCLFVKPFLTIVIVVLHSLPSSSTSTKHSKKSERDEILGEEKNRKEMLCCLLFVIFASYFFSSLVRFICSWMHFVTTANTISATSSSYNEMHGNFNWAASCVNFSKSE